MGLTTVGRASRVGRHLRRPGDLTLLISAVIGVTDAQDVDDDSVDCGRARRIAYLGRTAPRYWRAPELYAQFGPYHQSIWSAGCASSLSDARLDTQRSARCARAARPMARCAGEPAAAAAPPVRRRHGSARSEVTSRSDQTPRHWLPINREQLRAVARAAERTYIRYALNPGSPRRATLSVAPAQNLVGRPPRRRTRSAAT